MIRCCIFDLDGVIVDTAEYHYLAWAALARELGFEFTPAQSEATKGVSRMASLNIVLRAGGLENRFSPEEKERMAVQKNARYLAHVATMTESDVFPGVVPFLRELRELGVKVILGSSSKNAGTILDRCGIRELFDGVADGVMAAVTKPDPMIFRMGALLAHQRPANCVVFEDSAVGIMAAFLAGMRSVGVGKSRMLGNATILIESFEGFTFEKLLQQLD